MRFNMKLILLSVLLSQLFFIKIVAQTTNSKENIENTIDKYMKYFSNDYPGVIVTVIKNGDIAYNKAYGLSNIEDNSVMTTDKQFNLSVLSKTFTAYAILELVNKNKIQLDDNLTTIFKGFPEYGKTVKIQNLLNHTSGLKNYDSEKTKLNDDVLNYLKHQDSLIYEPGTKWQYSNSDYAILVKVIEKVSKKTYKKYLEKYIFKKISMDNTFLSEDITKIENLSDAHFKNDGKYEVDQQLSYIYGEQGIYSNSIDYAKWDNLIFNNELIKTNFTQQIFKLSKLNNGDTIPNAGLGWSLMEKNGIPYYWQGGSFGGYTNFVVHFPKTNTTILLLTNRNDAYDLLRISIRIAKLFDKQLIMKFG